MFSGLSLGIEATFIITFMLFYLIISGFLEYYHIHFIHESGVAIIIGILSGIAIFLLQGSEIIFDAEIFFYVLVPIIFFSEAYTTRKRYFIKNIMIIIVLGFVGTLINFLFLFTINYLVFFYFKCLNLNLTMFELLAYSIFLSSIECVIIKATIIQEKKPILFSISFGEELINDVTVYSLFTAFLELTHDDAQFNISTAEIFQFLTFFFYQILMSIILGILFGVSFTVMSKYFRFLYKNEKLASAYILYTAYISYSITKSLHYAAAVTIFVVGYIYSHYLSYNITYRSTVNTKAIVGILSYMSESLVYLYLGLSLPTLFLSNNNQKYELDWSFVFLEVGLIICMRILVFYPVISVYEWIRKQKLSPYYKTQVMLCGMIRGVLSFALMQYLIFHLHHSTNEINRQFQILDSSIIMIIVILNLSVSLSLYLINRIFFKNENLYSEEEEVDTNENKQKTNKSKISLLLIKFDHNYLKPFFIFDFQKRELDIGIKKETKTLQQSQTEIIPDFSVINRSNSIAYSSEQKNIELVSNQQ